jgi:flagellar biosynthesis protein FlhF
MLQQQGGSNTPHTHLLNLWRAALREAMLPDTVIDKLLFSLDEILTPSALQQTEIVAATLGQRLIAAIPPASGAIQPGQPGHPLIFVLVGPTGVGKTTTLAKLAARYSVQHRLPVALITAVTFRIGAVGQLRTYSDLMRAPLEVAYTPQELADHVAYHQDKAIIFIDTPGRSPTDTEQLEVLRSFMAVLPDPHLQIAVAAGTLLGDAQRIVERFSVIRPSGILLTKLDETTLLGPACALLAAAALPISYVTTGQRVPEDIEIAAVEKLVDRLFQTASQKLHREETTLPLSQSPATTHRSA